MPHLLEVLEWVSRQAAPVPDPAGTLFVIYYSCVILLYIVYASECGGSWLKLLS